MCTYMYLYQITVKQGLLIHLYFFDEKPKVNIQSGHFFGSELENLKIYFKNIVFLTLQARRIKLVTESWPVSASLRKWSRRDWAA